MFSPDPSFGTVFSRGCRRGLKTFLREREWGASFATLFGVLILLQLLLVGLAGVQAVHELLRSRTDLRLEIREDAPRGEVQKFFSSLGGQAFVDEAVFITKEQAFFQAKRTDPELISFLEEFKLGNPFRDTIAVTLSNLDAFPLLSTFVGKPEWNHIVDPTFLSTQTDQEQQVKDLLTMTSEGRALMVILLTLTGGILLLITIDLTRRNVARRAEEICIERLVGATRLSMTLPFVVETVVLLWFAVLFSIAAVSGFLFLLPQIIPSLAFGVLSPLRTQISEIVAPILPSVVLFEFLAAPLIGWMGTSVGLKRVLRSTRLVAV